MRHNKVVFKAAKRGLLLAAFLASAGAMADGPYVSGPSIAKLSQAVTFIGRSFAPNLPITVMLTRPNGTASAFGAVTAADGSFSYTLVASQQGQHDIKVADSSGRALASATLAALP